MPKSKCYQKVVQQKFFKTAGGSNFDLGRSIVVTDNRVYLTGIYNGVTGVDFTGKPIETLQGGGDIFVASLDHCGKQKFFKTAGSVFLDTPRDIAVHNNCVYVTGVIGPNTIDFHQEPVSNLLFGANIFVAGLDSCGNQKLFATAGSTDLTSVGNSLVVNNKDIFVAGTIGKTSFQDFKGEAPEDRPGNNNIFVASLDHYGKQKFFKTAGGQVRNDGSDIAFTKRLIFVTGTIGSTNAIDFAGKSVPTNILGDQEIFVAGLDHCGNQKFFVIAGGTSDIQGGSKVVSTKDRIYVVGIIGGNTAMDFSGNLIDLKSDADIFVACLDHCGNQKYFVTTGVNVEGTSGNISIFNDDVYVIGEILGMTGIDFNGNSIKNLKEKNIFVAKLDKCGNQKFYKTASALSENDAYTIKDIKVTNKRVYITGGVSGSDTIDFKKKIIPNLEDSTKIYLASLDHNGCQKYFKTAGGIFSSEGISLSTIDNKVFTTGFINETDGIDFRGCPIKNLQGNGDIFVARLDEDLPTLPLRTKMQYM